MEVAAQQFQIFRLTQEAYDQLWLFAKENPKAYLDPDTDFIQVLLDRGVTDYAEDTGIVANRPISLTPVERVPANRADRQAIDFHRSMPGVTPSAATDSLMWTWMTHFRLHSYSIKRWRLQGDLTNHIRNHWFVGNESDALRQNNTASRTWWIANTAVKAAKASGGAFTEEEAINHFANNPRHYHNMMDSNFSRHPVVCAEMLLALMTEARGISGVGSDQIWKRMNLAAGTLLLDAMPREQLRERINRYIDEIMSVPELVSDRTKLRNRVPWRVLSLGAGVQSSCLALLADRGEYDLPKPDFAIFADTGWEPQAVYEHLDWLESQLSFEVIRVNNGNIRENILQGRMPDGSKFLGIPAFLRNPDGSTGILHRQCTTHYKTKPIHDYLRSRLGLKPGRRAPSHVQVEMWLGISTDEAVRQKPDREEWVTKWYPLIELGFSRAQLLNWFKENYPDRQLPSSSCVGCPYHNDSVWKQLKEGDPKSFQDAVFIDQALRDVPAIKQAVKGAAYLHRSRTPLLAVDFDEVPSYEDLMLEECEGLCGI